MSLFHRIPMNPLDYNHSKFSSVPDKEEGDRNGFPPDIIEEVEERKRIQIFLAWLDENGALFPKLSWPRNDTKSGIRGVIALEDIPTNDYTMLQIPLHLMMSPIQAMRDSVYGDILKQHLSDILYGDFLLAMFIMIELVKGKDSFYYPYLSILPVPSCLSEWTEEELSILQDGRVYIRAKNKKSFLQASYDRVVKALSQKYPELFPLDQFTFQRFSFSWNTIQARAFGRRLPWTALVPFADCLNHSNVQTKYDYNIEENGVFRLFPTGKNAYKKGEEVFNSYGRRNNENLLLEYGFAMLDNEWDEVEMGFELMKSPPSLSASLIGFPQTKEDKEEDEYYYEKYHLLSYFGYSLSKMFLSSRYYVPLQAFGFLRIVFAPKSLMARWKALESQSISKVESDSAPTEEYLIEKLRIFKEKKEKENNNIPNPYQNDYSEEGDVGKKLSRKTEDYRLFRDITSVEIELILIEKLIEKIHSILNNFPTSAEYDELLFSLGKKGGKYGNRVRKAFLAEIIYHLQDKYDFQDEIFEFNANESAEDGLEDNSEQDEENQTKEIQTKIQRKLFAILQEESSSDVKDATEFPDIKDERTLKVIHSLTASPSSLDGNAWSGLTYRLTRKRVYLQILSNLELLKQYCRELLSIQVNGKSSTYDEKNEIKANGSNNSIAIVNEYYDRLTLELRSLPTFPRHILDEQYVEKLRLYLVQLFESSLTHV